MLQVLGPHNVNIHTGRQFLTTFLCSGDLKTVISDEKIKYIFVTTIILFLKVKEKCIYLFCVYLIYGPRPQFLHDLVMRRLC